MANINKISVAGEIYDIQDQNASKTVELTQAEYNGLAVKNPNTFYIITDAQGGDLSNYYTKGETDTLLEEKQPTLVSGTNIKTINNESLLGEGNIDIQGGSSVNVVQATGTSTSDVMSQDAVTKALGEKQPTLVSGTNIKTINNESLLGEGNINIQGGGGKAVNAGTNISITTGETADTINCTLNLVNGSGTNSVKMKNTYRSNGNGSFAIGVNGVNASGMGSFAGGYYSEATGDFSMAFGRYCIANNYGEVALGFHNKSNGSSPDFSHSSSNTLFSVGNGTDYGTQHNAFEIRQNGDIYCSDGTNDVKLQDTITATAANTAALGGLKLVKLTQSEYDALQTKDANTLYIING